MDLELHLLDLRYEALRKRSAKRERQVLCSLSEVGQQLPIVVVGGGEQQRWIVIDGYKRVRALRRLKHDTVRATAWEVQEVEALLLDRMMRSGDGEGALEQGWLLLELEHRFGLTPEELSRRFDKSPSWVSRRLGLVRELPRAIQDRVRGGQIGAHVATKYLLPLARAKREAAERLTEAIAPLRLSTRQVGQLYGGWQNGDDRTRELIETQPEVYLKTLQAAEQEEPRPSEQLLSELGALGGIARRILRRLQRGLWRRLGREEQAEATRCAAQARADTVRLFARVDDERERAARKEEPDARPEHTHSDPAVA